MALSKFPTAMTEAATAVIAVAAALRHVAASSGDLTFSDLSEVQDGLRRAKVATVAALTEGARGGRAAETFMQSLGGPATMTEFRASSLTIEAAAAAWNSALSAALADMTAAELVALITVSRAGIETRHVEFAQFVPARVADPLRQSQALADLIAAFSAVGA